MAEQVFHFTIGVKLKDNSHAFEPGYNSDAQRLNRTQLRKMLISHIEDAVSSWGGQLWPDHVLFSQNFETVEVKWAFAPKKGKADVRSR